MDPTSCSPGWATDYWISDHSAQPCNVPLAAFYIIFILFMCLKVTILFGTWRFWLKRFKEMKKTKGALAQRHPFVPTLVTAIALGYFLMLVLVGTNAASSRNGGGTSLYAVTAGTWGVYTGFHVKKYISLGRKLIPLAQAQYRSEDASRTSDSGHVKGTGGISAAAETRLSILSKIDAPLQVMLSLMGITVFLIFGFGLIPVLVYPWDLRWARVVFGLVGAYALFLYVSLMWHLERLVNATKICGQGMPASTGSQKLARAIRIMRISQLVWFVTGNMTFATHLLAAVGVIDLSWIYMFCMLLIETSASTFAFLLTARPKRSRPIHDTTSNNKDNNTLTGPQNCGPSSFQSMRLNHNPTQTAVVSQAVAVGVEQSMTDVE